MIKNNNKTASLTKKLKEKEGYEIFWKKRSIRIETMKTIKKI